MAHLSVATWGSALAALHAEHTTQVTKKNKTTTIGNPSLYSGCCTSFQTPQGSHFPQVYF